MNEKLWIHVGAGLNHFPVIEDISKHLSEKKLVLIDRNPLQEYAKLDVQVLNSSIYDIEKISGEIANLSRSYGLIGCYPVSDNAIPAICNIYKIFNHKPNIRRALKILKNKAATYKHFALSGLPIPSTIYRQSDINQMQSSSKQYIFKPNEGSDSYGIKRIYNLSNIEQRVVSEVTNGIGIIQEIMKGDLYNIDFFIDNYEPIFQSINRRIQSHHSSFLTTLVIQEYKPRLSFFSKLRDSVAKFTKKIGYQEGALTLDMILDSDKYFLLEASPFYHKPWLNILRAPMKCTLPFLFEDHSRSDGNYLDRKINVHAFELLVLNPSTLNSSDFWDDLRRTCQNFKSDHKRRNKQLSLRGSSSRMPIYASIKGTISSDNSLNLIKLHSIYKL